MFDTPCGIAVMNDGSLVVADTGNNQLRKITTDGNVTTLPITDLSRPIGLAVAHDNFLYVTELDRSRVIQIVPDNASYTIASQFNQPSGVAIHPKTTELYVTDSANYLVRKLVQQNNANTQAAAQPDALPKLTNETLGQQSLLWPLAPQQSPHEVVATMGEVRGVSTPPTAVIICTADSTSSARMAISCASYATKKSPRQYQTGDSTRSTKDYASALFPYIHMHVGRDKDAKVFDDPRFIHVKKATNSPACASGAERVSESGRRSEPLTACITFT